MNDRIHQTRPLSSSPKPEVTTPVVVRRDRPSRLARGTEQGFPSTEAGGDDALDEALRRGIALLCAEQLEHSFFSGE